jgi:hypothetical protein
MNLSLRVLQAHKHLKQAAFDTRSRSAKILSYMGQGYKHSLDIANLLVGGTGMGWEDALKFLQNNGQDLHLLITSLDNLRGVALDSFFPHQQFGPESPHASLAQVSEQNVGSHPPTAD